jgi:hypothetical protein
MNEFQWRTAAVIIRGRLGFSRPISPKRMEKLKANYLRGYRDAESGRPATNLSNTPEGAAYQVGVEAYHQIGAVRS